MMIQLKVPSFAWSQSTEKLTPFEIAEIQQYAAVDPVGSLVGVKNTLDAVCAQVVETTTAVVPLNVPYLILLSPAVASWSRIVFPEVDITTSPAVEVISPAADILPAVADILPAEVLM